MSCANCKNWVATDIIDYCRILSCWPPTTGNPKTCPYFEKKVNIRCRTSYK